MIAAPVIVYNIYKSPSPVAFWVFFIAGLTDWLDGFLARFYNQESHFGQLLDPLADKILITSVIIVLTLCHYLPYWFSFLIIARDLMILVGAFIVQYKKYPFSLKPLFISKLNTFFQIFLCLCLLAKISFFQQFSGLENLIKGLLYITMGSTVLSGFSYAKLFYQYFVKAR